MYVIFVETCLIITFGLEEPDCFNGNLSEFDRRLKGTSFKDTQTLFAQLSITQAHWGEPPGTHRDCLKALFLKKKKNYIGVNERLLGSIFHVIRQRGGTI